MQHLFDSVCKQVSQPVPRRKVLSIVFRSAGTALLARTGLRSAFAQTGCTANGSGPCVPGPSSGCCSGACSVNLKCEPVGGCNVDADCAAGSWCMESTNTCTAQLANGTPIPSDAPHLSPTLNGICTSAAGTLVCASGVCDSADNKCGYANGDGPCNSVNQTSVCRSGFCNSSSGVCAAVGSCGGNTCSTPYTCVSAPNPFCLQNNSSAVRINTSGWLFSRVSQHFSGTLTVTNTSGSPIKTPIVVELSNLASGVTLTNGSGVLSGVPLVTVRDGPGTLGVGAMVNVNLQFQNPSNAAIVFNPVTYTG